MRKCKKRLLSPDKKRARWVLHSYSARSFGCAWKIKGGGGGTEREKRDRSNLRGNKKISQSESQKQRSEVGGGVECSREEVGNGGRARKSGDAEWKIVKTTRLEGEWGKENKKSVRGVSQNQQSLTRSKNSGSK